MKSFVVSLVILVLIFSFVLLNSIFLDRKFSILQRELQEILIDVDAYSSSENIERIRVFHKTWENVQSVMRLTFRRELIQDFDQSVISMEFFAQCREHGEYVNSVVNVYDLLDEMEQNNRFNFSVLI